MAFTTFERQTRKPLRVCDTKVATTRLRWGSDEGGGRIKGLLRLKTLKNKNIINIRKILKYLILFFVFSYRKAIIVIYIEKTKER